MTFKRGQKWSLKRKRFSSLLGTDDINISTDLAVEPAAAFCLKRLLIT